MLSSKYRSLITTFIRRGSYYKSPFLEDLQTEPQRTYQLNKSEEVWTEVQRCLSPLTVPKPKTEGNFPSGWKPQLSTKDSYPYFIRRSRNHMLPVYLEITQLGYRKITKVRNIYGDLYRLEKELRDFLQIDSVRPVRSQVNEFVGYIRFHGDHVNAVKHWLTKRNF